MDGVTEDFKVPHERPSVRVKLARGGVDGSQHRAVKGREWEFYSHLSKHILINEEEVVVCDVVVYAVEPGAIIIFAAGGVKLFIKGFFMEEPANLLKKIYHDVLGIVVRRLVDG